MYTYICDNNIVVFARSSQSVFRSIVLLFITLVINERLPFRCALFVKSIDVTSREKLLFVIRNSTNILYIFSFYDFLQSPYIIKKYLHVASPRLAVTVRVMVFLNVRVRVLKKKKNCNYFPANPMQYREMIARSQRSWCRAISAWAVKYFLTISR